MVKKKVLIRNNKVIVIGENNKILASTRKKKNKNLKSYSNHYKETGSLDFNVASYEYLGHSRANPSKKIYKQVSKDGKSNKQTQLLITADIYKGNKKIKSNYKQSTPKGFLKSGRGKEGRQYVEKPSKKWSKASGVERFIHMKATNDGIIKYDDDNVRIKIKSVNYVRYIVR